VCQARGGEQATGSGPDDNDIELRCVHCDFLKT
jgi:hypothetical protein